MQSLGNGVLVISSAYAPNDVVGAKRFTFLSEELHRQGLDVRVLTLAQRDSTKLDTSLPCLKHVYRSRLPLPYPVTPDSTVKKIYLRLLQRYIGIPDPYVSWLLTGLFTGYRLIRRHKVGVVIATTPYFTSVLMGALLSRFTGARLIIDYRDPLSGYDWPTRRGVNRTTPLTRWLEKRVVRSASAIVFVTEDMRRHFQRILGPYTRAPLHVITNGYHPTAELEPLYLDAGKVNLLYAGTFYGDRKLGLLLKPLDELIREGSVSADSVRIHIFGTLSVEDRNLLRELDQEHLIREHSKVDHTTILRYMKGADILFLLSGEDVTYALPYKLFDYLAAQRPILAIAPRNSAVAAFMEHVHCGELGIIDAPISTKDALSTILRKTSGYSFAETAAFQWKQLGERYANIIQALLLPTPPPLSITTRRTS
ncbi:MAG: glycosyltransferase [Deferrisomatales bacterium]|nr:glycosyltransferase [Deferrisomatales bacterium]